MRKNTLFLSTLWLSLLGLNGCSGSHSIDTSFLNRQSTPLHADAAGSQFGSAEYWQGDASSLWAKLGQIPYAQLMANQNTPDENAAAWIKLAMISKGDSLHTTTLVRDLMAWRAQYPGHPGNQLFADNNTLNRLLSNTPPERIAVLLPLEGAYSDLGNAVRNGLLNAYFAELAKTAHPQIITFYDTNKNPNINALYQEAISKGADIVIGPLLKDKVQALTSQGHFTVPTIALNYTDLWFGSLPNNFYQFGLSPLDEAKQIADKAWQTGRSRAIIIAPQDDWGKNVAKSLSSRWQTDGGAITETFYFAPKTDFNEAIPQLLHIDVKADRDKTRNADENNKANLESQRRQDFDVVFLLASPESARSIVPLLRYYYVTDIPIYATSTTYAGTPNPQKDTDLDGVLFCDSPAVLQGSGIARLFAVGQDAYLISRELPRFIALPNFPAYSATGALTLTPQHQFYRRLAWAQFHNGHP